MVRRSNVHFKLTVLKQLTLLAMASIDANYWTKCIQHMFKEIDYYIYYDNIDIDDDVIPPVVINESEVLPMDIDVSNNAVLVTKCSQGKFFVMIKTRHYNFVNIWFLKSSYYTLLTVPIY